MKTRLGTATRFAVGTGEPDPTAAGRKFFLETPHPHRLLALLVDLVRRIRIQRIRIALYSSIYSK